MCWENLVYQSRNLLAVPLTYNYSFQKEGMFGKVYWAKPSLVWVTKRTPRAHWPREREGFFSPVPVGDTERNQTSAPVSLAYVETRFSHRGKGPRTGYTAGCEPGRIRREAVWKFRDGKAAGGTANSEGFTPGSGEGCPRSGQLCGRGCAGADLKRGPLCRCLAVARGRGVRPSARAQCPFLVVQSAHIPCLNWPLIWRKAYINMEYKYICKGI